MTNAYWKVHAISCMWLDATTLGEASILFPVESSGKKKEFQLHALQMIKV